MEGRPRLESWKEISTYLGRSLSTCHRWEEEMGLPIHRLDGTPKARVFALPDEIDQWLGGKLHLAGDLAKDEGRPRHLTRPSALAWTGTLAVVAGLVFATWRFVVPAPAPYNNPWLAVLPFENVTDDERLEPWATAFGDLLTTDLRQSRYVNALALSEVDIALRALKLSGGRKFGPSEIVKIAAELETDYVTTGTLVRAGEDIVVKTVVYDARARELASSVETGSGEISFLAMADRFSRRLKAVVRLSPRSISRDIDRPVTEVGSASPEAFRLYSQGHRLVNRGELEEGFRCLQGAVDLDPGFGLAYKLLFSAAARAARVDDATRYAETAIRLGRGISKRELLLLEAEYYQLHRHDLAKALEANETLWALFPDYPDAPGGRLFLPLLYMRTEDYGKLIAAFEKMAVRRRRQSGAPSSFVACCLATGQFDKAEKYIADLESLNPGAKEVIFALRHDLLIAQRRFDEALAMDGLKPGDDPHPADPSQRYRLGYCLWAADDFIRAERAYGAVFTPGDLPEKSSRLADLAVVALARGRIERMAELARRGIEVLGNSGHEEEASRWHYVLAVSHRLAGRLPEALKEAEESCQGYQKAGSPALAALQLRALIELELGRTEEFDNQTEELRTVVESGTNPRLMRAYFHLLGHRELRQGQLAKARGYFWKALDLLPGVRQGLGDGDPVRHFYAMALALTRAGADSDSIPYYEKVVRTVTGRSFSGDLYAKSFYAMGRAYERLSAGADSQDAAAGLRLRAMENYRKFLTLWRDADPIFPEIEDARLRLAGLEAGPANLP